MQGGQDIFVFSFSGSVMDGKTQYNIKSQRAQQLVDVGQQSCVRSTRDGTASKATRPILRRTITGFISPFSPANAFCIHIYVLHQTFKVQHPDTHFLLPYPKYRCLTTVKIFRLPLSSQEMEMIHSQKEREARQITHFLAMFGLQAAPNPLTQVVSSHPYPFPCTPTSPLSPHLSHQAYFPSRPSLSHLPHEQATDLESFATTITFASPPSRPTCASSSSAFAR
jgi:hypothetical protein